MIWNKNAKPLSWSAISSFKYDPEQWYKKYVLGKKPKTSVQMEFGSKIGKSLETDKKFMPEVPRYKIMEYELRAPFYDFELVVYCDSYDPNKKALLEYKTSSNPNKWTQDSVNKHMQLDMYALMLFIKEKVRPEELKINLIYIPVEDTFDEGMKVITSGEIKNFATKRTMKDILAMGAYITKTVQEMEEYAINYE
jgi:hypothetical protein